MSPFRDTPVFCALINGEGEVVDFLRLPYFMKRRNAFREEEREKKVRKQSRQGVAGHYSELTALESVCLLQALDIENLKKFLSSKKPHVIAVAGENR